jgi:Uma2 family endonuclease
MGRTNVDVAVEIGNDVRYPDVLVEQQHGDGTELSTDKPVLRVEVLPPTSTALDMTVKLAEYIQLSTLEAYIVASQDELIIWVWQRDAESGVFPQNPVEFVGRDAVCNVGGPSVWLPLGELYRGISCR